MPNYPTSLEDLREMMAKYPLEVDAKQTNPKDAVGATKLSMHLVPDTLIAFAALAFTEGALKYGKFNWRVAGVRASIYLDALERHMAKYRNGEWDDPVTRVPHLANALACIGILLDAHVNAMLTDDRPPAAPAVGELIDKMPASIAHLKELFKEHSPHQHTIADAT